LKICENGRFVRDLFNTFDSRAERPENCSLRATIVKQFLAQRKVTVLDQPPYLPDFMLITFVLKSEIPLEGASL
jgi:hypothetical protein